VGSGGRAVGNGVLFKVGTKLPDGNQGDDDNVGTCEGGRVGNREGECEGI
jgi:hypothetical protein